MEGKIIVFGGSFNPPLYTHFSIAQQVLNEITDAKKIIFIPVNKKYPKDELEENNHRYNMLKLVINKNDKFDLSNLDIKNKEKRSLYLIEILDYIQEQFKNNKICFLIGSDNLKEFHTWYKAETILSKYKLIVIERNNDSVEKIIEKDELLKLYEHNIIKISNNIRNNCSSTYVRKQIREGKNVKYLIPNEIYKYICENSLYKKC